MSHNPGFLADNPRPGFDERGLEVLLQITGLNHDEIVSRTKARRNRSRSRGHRASGSTSRLTAALKALDSELSQIIP